MKKLSKITIGKVISITATILLILSTVLCFTVIKQINEKGYVSLGGNSFFKVVTGSMSPEIEVGELIRTSKVSIDKIEIGDIVSFISVSPKTQGLIITHRVIDIETDDNGEIMLVTKGDANLPVDTEPVTESNYIGMVVWSSGGRNFMETVHSFLTNKSAFFVCVVAPCLLIFGFVFKDSVSKIKRDLELLRQETEKIEGVGKSDEEDGDKKDDTLSKESANANGDALEAFKESNPDDFAQMYKKIQEELIEELKQGDNQGQSTK